MKTPKDRKAPQFFTTHDIAALTGTSPSTVHKWLEKGLLRASRTPGGHRRIRGEDLKDFLLAHQMPVPKELGGADVLRVVAVDDDEIVLNGMKRAIKRVRPKWDLLTFTSGVKALLAMSNQPPDVVVLDVFMPEMDGFTVCQELKANPATQHVTVIATSGRHSAEVEKKTQKAGAAMLIKKPFEPEELVTAIEAAVGLPTAPTA